MLKFASRTLAYSVILFATQGHILTTLAVAGLLVMLGVSSYWEGYNAALDEAIKVEFKNE